MSHVHIIGFTGWYDYLAGDCVGFRKDGPSVIGTEGYERYRIEGQPMVSLEISSEGSLHSEYTYLMKVESHELG